MPKNDNMLAILWMLNSGEKITAKQISERLEINIRSVYLYVFDTMADWEIGYLSTEINSIKGGFCR